MSENLLYEWQQFREQIDYAHHVLDCNEAPIHPDADGTCKLTVGGRITALITSKDQRIAALTQQLADSEAARNELSDKLMASNRRCAAAEGERDYYKGAYERTLDDVKRALDSALQRDTLAREAVGVLEKYVIEDCECEECASGLAFLARPDVVKIGGGKC